MMFSRTLGYGVLITLGAILYFVIQTIYEPALKPAMELILQSVPASALIVFATVVSAVVVFAMVRQAAHWYAKKTIGL